MTEALTLRQQLEILIAEQPGIGSDELATFFTELPSYRNAVSAALSNLYSRGGYRRERKGKTFHYWPDPQAQPEALPHRAKQTEAGAHAECARLREKIAELEAWKTDALARFPVLAVPPLVLKAREIVAEQLRECSDPEGARQALAGARDNTTLVKTVVRALEYAA